MDAEIIFFMSSKDQFDFLDLAEGYCDSIEIENNSKKYLLKVGGCHLSFTPSDFEFLTLYAGKLEIRMSKISGDVSLTDQERAKTSFRKLRNWLKKNYWSRLAYLNTNKKNKLTPSRNHWLGPDAKDWKEADLESRSLRLSKTSCMTFEIGY